MFKHEKQLFHPVEVEKPNALNNMDTDLLLVAKDDELGRKLQDLKLTPRRRASKVKERIASNVGISRSGIELMRPAFTIS